MRTRFEIINTLEGRPITFEPFTVRSDAEAFIPLFVERYRRQGYYSAPGRRVSLDELPQFLEIWEIDE